MHPDCGVGEGVGGGAVQAGSAQPNSHSIPRTSSSLPSMAHIACALRWKLNDARREIAAAEPLAKASKGAFVLMGPPPRVPPFDSTRMCVART